MANTKYVSGFREAQALLKQLPQNVENRVLQAATMAAAREMRKTVKANAPKSTGKRSKASLEYKRLSQNITARPLKSAKRKGQRGARVSTGKAFWGYILEFGSRFIAARPWFRPAVESSREQATKALRDGLAKGLDREAEKLARKYGVK